MDQRERFQAAALSRRADGDERRPQHAVGDQVALLQDGDDGVRLLRRRNDADRLVLVRVELRARGRVDLDDLVALERRGQLAQRGVDAFEQLLGRRRRDGDRRLEAVLHRQQALGEALDGELARLAHFFLGAAPDVLGFGLGAQVGVGELGVARFEVGVRRRAAGGAGSLAAGGRPAPLAGLGRGGVVRVHPARREAHPLDFKGDLRARASDLSVRVGRGAPAVPVGELAPVALGRPALLDRQRRLGVELALGRPGQPALDALRRLLVERLRGRRRPAQAAQRLARRRSGSTRPGAARRRRPRAARAPALATCSLTETRPLAMSSAASARVL